MKRVKSRQVGGIEIFATPDFKLFIEDKRSGRVCDVTEEYKGQPVSKETFNELEQKIRSGEHLHLYAPTGNGRLLRFLKK